MKKKLGLLNVLLAALFVWGGVVFYGQYESARQRYAVFDGADGMADLPAMPAAAEAPAVRAADYAAISQRLLLSRDRNPVIEVIVPDEEVEQPELPLLRGVIDLGDGPLALLTPDDDTPPRWTGVGEKVGEYTLEAFAEDTLTLAWNGASIELLLSDLAAVKFDERERQRSERRRTVSRPSANREMAASRSGRSAPSLAAANAVVEKGKYTIGRQVTSGVYAADPTDGAPDGFEYKGYVRRVRVTPFGSQHWWQKKE